MPFPPIGIVGAPSFHFSSWHAWSRPTTPAAKDVDAGTGPCMTNLSRKLRSDVGNALHHGVTHTGIIQRMASTFDHADFGIRPARGERLRRRGRAEQVVAA